MKTFLLSILVMLVAFISCNTAAPGKTNEFFSLFEEGPVGDTIKMEEAQVTEKSRMDTSTHSSNEVPPHLYTLLELPAGFPFDSSSYTAHAIKRFSIVKGFDGFVVRFKDHYSRESVICLYVFDEERRRVGEPVTVGYSAGSEGAEHRTETFAVDLNNDKAYDLITRRYECYITTERDTISETVIDTLIAKRWSKNGYVETTLKDYQEVKRRIKIDGLCL